MKLRYRIGLAFSILILLSLMGCARLLGPSETFRESDLVSTIASTAILPGLEAFESSATSLNITVAALVADPTIDHLEAAQAQWKAAMAAWQKTLVYQVGPASDESIIQKLNYWPRDIDTIETVLNGSSTLNQDAVAIFGVKKKGFPVLEYLLFGIESDNNAIVSAISSNSRLGDYLVALSENIEAQSEYLLDQWQVDGGNYLDSFKGSSNALNMIVNQLVQQIETIRDAKIAKPLGKTTGTSRVDEQESFESGVSLTSIADNLTGVSVLFNGGESRNTGQGLYGYLVFRGFRPLAESIEDQLKTMQDTLTDLDSASLTEWIQNNPDAVDALYTQFTQLVRLLKVDMANAVNQTIYFNDSDGD